METSDLCTAWTTAIAGFNDNDYSLLEQLLDPVCVFEFVGRSRDEIIDALKADRAAGWLRHTIVSVSAAGTVLASIAENSFADGSVHHVAGVVRFNQDGRIAYITAADERAPLPTAAS